MKKEENFSLIGFLRRFFLEIDIDTILFSVPISDCLDRGDLGILPLRLEEVAEPFLGL